MSEGTTIEPGKLWVCLKCGKTSKTQFGFDAGGENTAMHGWDESCLLNSRLYDEDRLVRRKSGVVIGVRREET